MLTKTFDFSEEKVDRIGSKCRSKENIPIVQEAQEDTAPVTRATKLTKML